MDMMGFHDASDPEPVSTIEAPPSSNLGGVSEKVEDTRIYNPPFSNIKKPSVEVIPKLLAVRRPPEQPLPQLPGQTDIRPSSR